MILFVKHIVSLLQFHKILQYLKSHITALLRMELACKHIVFLHGSMDMCTVIREAFTICASAAFR